MSITTAERLTSHAITPKLTIGLSKSQVALLVYFFEGVREREEHFLNREKGRDQAYCRMSKGLDGRCSGGAGCRPNVPWVPFAYLKRPPTRSESASLSRCLKRLAARGLVEPIASWGKHKNCVDVTEEGRKVAAASLGVTDPYPTEADYQLAYHPGKSIEQIRHEREVGRKAFMASLERMRKR